LQLALEVFKGADVCQRGERQQVALLLVLVSDHGAGHCCLGVQILLPERDSGLRLREIDLRLAKLGRLLQVLGLGDR
jgi:hypothetical protein